MRWHAKSIFVVKRTFYLLMLLLSCLCFSYGSSYLFADKAPPYIANSTCYPIAPINTLSSLIDKDTPVWIAARVVEQTDVDTYLIEDDSGSIILFLSDDTLSNILINVDDHLLVYGTVDVSQVTSDKNEFYAERILLSKNEEKNSMKRGTTQ